MKADDWRKSAVRFRQLDAMARRIKVLEKQLNVKSKTRNASDIKEIREYLPHHYPFLLVDRVVELELEKTCEGDQNVTCNEDFFNGHFPIIQSCPVY